MEDSQLAEHKHTDSIQDDSSNKRRRLEQHVRVASMNEEDLTDPEASLATVPVKSSDILSLDFTRVDYPDPAGRNQERSYLLAQMPDGSVRTESTWSPHIASLLGRACGRSLKNKTCNNPACPYLHICKAWETRPQSGGEGCPHNSLEHDGLIHVLPTCLWERKGHGSCQFGDFCHYGHDHMEIRRHRESLPQMEVAHFKSNGTYPKPTFTTVRSDNDMEPSYVVNLADES
ncbi:hypothetical protein KCU81_g4307, partial [Aureobasidium melanogenum]